MLVSERIGWFFVDEDGAGDRLEFTEYGAGEAWVVLVPGLLLPRRMHQPLARALAARGLHVVTLDPLGHGRSDRPADPLTYSVRAFADQVLALMDHLGVDRAVVGGVSVGAGVALEVAAVAPERVAGLLLEAPALDHALGATLMTWVPLLVAARVAPWTVWSTRWGTRWVPRGVVPFWAGIGLDSLDQRPGAVAAVLHGVLAGGLAPPAARRRRIVAPALVVGHPGDPLHPLADAVLLAGELAHARLERAASIAEWRVAPRRLDDLAAGFALDCVDTPLRRRRGGA